VDCHAHVFHRGLKFVPTRTYTPDYDAPAEQHLAMLDKNGMSHGVIIPISIVGTDNSYTRFVTNSRIQACPLAESA
jgi:predicted TIM-barrel fold metal-dependent hydrolase